jgi:hypothetical protein
VNAFEQQQQKYLQTHCFEWNLQLSRLMFCLKFFQLIVKNDIVLEKATLYEREVIKMQKILFAGRSSHTHTTGG